MTQSPDKYEHARHWLRTRRVDTLKLTLREAAVAGGCSDAWLCQIETGTASLMKLQVGSLTRLAKAYQIDVPVLLRLLCVCPCCPRELPKCQP